MKLPHLHQVLADLDRSLWKLLEGDAPVRVRVIMNVGRTARLTASPRAQPTPPPANDLP